MGTTHAHAPAPARAQLQTDHVAASGGSPVLDLTGDAHAVPATIHVASPTDVPASRKDLAPPSEADILTWVRTGTAFVRFGPGRLERVDAGTGIWVPAGLGHDMWTSPGTVAYPLILPDGRTPGTPGDIVRFGVEPDWHEWLVDRYAGSVTRHVESDLHDVLAVLDGTAARHVARTASVEDVTPEPPSSGPAGIVARAITADPADARTLDDWARVVHVSPSALRRAFARRGGPGFAEWRRHVRLTTARAHILAGDPVDTAAARVGYASRAGFARAFAARFHVTPAELAAAVAAHGSAHTATDAGWSGAPRAAPVSSPSDNLMLWVRGGRLRARHDDRCVVARRGDVIWLPPGTHVDATPDLRTIPLSTLCTDCVRLQHPVRTHFPPMWDDYLSWCSVSTHTLLHAHHLYGVESELALPFDHHVIETFRARRAADVARRVPIPRTAGAARIARAYLATLGTDDDIDSDSDTGTDTEPATGKVLRELDEAFLRETGMDTTRWRYAARMRAARALLRRDTEPGTVAARVGYAHASSFTRAFRAFHGATPSEFREIEADDAD